MIRNGVIFTGESRYCIPKAKNGKFRFYMPGKGALNSVAGGTMTILPTDTKFESDGGIDGYSVVVLGVGTKIVYKDEDPNARDDDHVWDYYYEFDIIVPMLIRDWFAMVGGNPYGTKATQGCVPMYEDTFKANMSEARTAIS